MLIVAKLNLKDYSWVIRGKQRRDIIRHIREIDTPTQISQKSGYSLNNTSRVLNEFSKKSIAKCINPKQKTGRLYTLTSKGRLIKSKISLEKSGQ
jgi:predicted transcriptional regulator